MQDMRWFIASSLLFLLSLSACGTPGPAVSMIAVESEHTCYLYAYDADNDMTEIEVSCSIVLLPETNDVSFCIR